MSDEIVRESFAVPPAYSSVEIERNSRGYNWKIKVYAPAGQEETILPIIKSIDHAIRIEFASAPGGK